MAKKSIIKKNDDDPCWKDYTQRGMKIKNGKEVPNCIPVKKATKKNSA